MSFISEPFALLLRAFYSFTKNYAVALIFFTLVIKLLFSFVNILQQRSAQGQARIRPKINAIRKRYEGRKDSHVQIEFQSDMQKLYQEEKVSASMGCLPLLIQLLIVMVLYQIVYNPLTYIAQLDSNDFTTIKQIIVDNFGTMTISSESISKSIKSVLDDAEVIDKVKGLKLSEMDYVSIISQNKGLFGTYASKLPDFTVFGGAINLAEKPRLALDPIVLIPVLTVVFQLGSFFITRIFAPKPDTSTPEAQQTAKTMMMTNVAMTLVSGYIAFSFPAIIGVYWIYQSIIGTVITIVLHKVMPIPSYTPEEMLAIEEEYNKDYVRPEIPAASSPYGIDDYEDDDEYDEENDDAPSKSAYDDIAMPERRRYDENGNKIRSLHFIDEDDDDEMLEGQSEYNSSDEDSENED